MWNNSRFLIQLSDTQFGMFDKNKSFEKETVLYEKAVGGIKKLKPDFVVITVILFTIRIQMHS